MVSFDVGRSAIVFLLGIVVAPSTWGAEQPRLFRAGAHAADITPTQFPVSSNGSMRDRRATVAHDSLRARCLVMDNGMTRVGIVVCDSCMIPRDIFDEAKRQAAATTGIPVQNMLMSATHAHTGVTVTGVFQSEPEEEYRSLLIDRIVEGLEAAVGRLEPAQVGWTTAEEPTQVFNRRWFMKSGYEYVDPFSRGTAKVRLQWLSADAGTPRTGRLRNLACQIELSCRGRGAVRPRQTDRIAASTRGRPERPLTRRDRGRSLPCR